MAKLRRGDTLEHPIFIPNKTHVNQKAMASRVLPGKLLERIRIVGSFDLRECLKKIAQCGSAKLVSLVQSIQEVMNLAICSKEIMVMHLDN